MKWFKLYPEMIDDPKLRLLAFEDRWHYVALLCCKAEGLQDEVEGLWEELLRVKLGLAQAEFESLKKRLLRVSLIDEQWNPTGWEKRQEAKDPKAAERQRKYREKQKKRNVTHNVTATSQVEEEVEVEEELKDRQKRKRFVPPTLEQVVERCQECNYGVDPNRFWNFYESQGWKVGKNPMRDWHKALAGWQSREGNQTSRKADFVDDLTDTSWAR
jgi:hypothetical protein